MMASPDARRSELARIHLLAKELRLSDDEYRDMIFTLCRVRSAGDLDDAGRKQLIEHLAARAKGYGEWSFIARASADRQPLLAKIRRQVGSRGKRYADGCARRICKAERLEFCAPDQLRQIVAALAYDAKRRAAKEA